MTEFVTSGSQEILEEVRATFPLEVWIHAEIGRVEQEIQLSIFSAVKDSHPLWFMLDLGFYSSFPLEMDIAATVRFHKNFYGSALHLESSIFQTIRKTFTLGHSIQVNTHLRETIPYQFNVGKDAIPTSGTYDIRVLLDGVDVTQQVNTCTVSYSIGNYCSEVNIEWADWELYSNIDTSDILKNYAEERIEVQSKLPESETWTSLGKFFLEKRDITKSFQAAVPTSWGRNRPAKLSDPYAMPINKTWLEDTNAIAVVQEISTDLGVTISWEIMNYVILGSNLTASEELPIALISRLAAVVGGALMTNKAGELRVVYLYDV
jgi:hypothetical protein